MIEWIIVILAIAGIVLIAKFSHLKHRFGVILLIVFLLFIYLTFSSVVSNNNINLKTASGLFKGIKLYFSWLGHAFDNLKVLTGNAIKMDWGTNSTG